MGRTLLIKLPDLPDVTTAVEAARDAVPTGPMNWQTLNPAEREAVLALLLYAIVERHDREQAAAYQTSASGLPPGWDE